MSIGGTILELSCIFSRCLLSLLFIVVAQRLKARKFQLVALKTSPGPTTVSPSPYGTTASSSSSLEATASSALSIELLSYPPPAELQLPTSLSLSLPEPLRDGVFDADVERVRMDLKGSDLSRKLALLSEVWAREFASAGVASGDSADQSQYGAAEDSGGFDLHHQKRLKYRGGKVGDCNLLVLNVDDVPLDEEFEKQVDQCLQVAATFVGKSWTVDALVRFKLDCLSIEEKLNPLAVSTCCEDESDTSDEISKCGSDEFSKCEEASEMLYGDTMTMAAPEDFKELHADLDLWIEELEKTNKSRDDPHLVLVNAR